MKKADFIPYIRAEVEKNHIHTAGPAGMRAFATQFVLPKKRTFAGLYIDSPFARDSRANTGYSPDLYREIQNLLESLKISMELRYKGWQGMFHTEENHKYFVFDTLLFRESRVIAQSEYGTGVGNLMWVKDHVSVELDHHKDYRRFIRTSAVDPIADIQGEMKRLGVGGVYHVVCPTPPTITDVLSGLISAHYYASEYTEKEYLKELGYSESVDAMYRGMDSYKMSQKFMVEINRAFQYPEIMQLRELMNEL